MFRFFAEDLQYKIASLEFRLRAVNNGPAKVLVNGGVKSGTTWMMYLIGSVPGYQRVGNFLENTEAMNYVPPGSIIHGHYRYSQPLAKILQNNDIKVIFMYRDPRDQAVSQVFHAKRDIYHPWHRYFLELEFDEALMAFVEGRDSFDGVAPTLPNVVSMIELTQSWLENGRALPVRYEDLHRNTHLEVRRVFDYLEIQVSDKFIDLIIRKNRFERLSVGRRIWKKPRQHGQEDSSSHFRKGITGDWRNHFRPAHTRRFKELAGEKLIELGYEQDLNWSGDESLADTRTQTVRDKS